MKQSLRRGAMLMLPPALLATLVACTPTVPLEPAADATNPECAEIVVRLPPTVAGLPIRQTNAQATGAWGSPAAVLLHCGVTPPRPTTTVCFTVSGVDWLRDSSKDPVYVFTTYGRTPATQVVIDTSLTKGAGGTNILDDLSNAVGSIAQKGKCTRSEDVLGSAGIPTEAPTPSPTPSLIPSK